MKPPPWAFRLFLAAVLAGVLCIPLGQAQAGPATDVFRRAQGAYEALSRNQDQARNPNFWLQVEGLYKQALQADPTGAEAPEVLFRLGRISEELGTLQGSRERYAEACANYRALAETFPDHDLAGIGQIRRARLYATQLGETEGAAAILRDILKKDPRGELAQPAKELLATLENGGAAPRSEPGQRPATAQRPAPGENAKPPPAAPRPDKELKVKELGPEGDATPPPAGRPAVPVAEAPKTLPAAPLAKGQGSQLAEQLGLAIRTIVLDPGHGGKDPGAIGHGLREKDLNLAIARKVASRLQARGFSVHFTRTRDVFIPLEDRTAFANDKKADLFVSIHINASPNPAGNGLETYSLNVAKTKEAQRVAARENGVSVAEISDLQVILTDLMLGAKVRESSDLAQLVQRATCNSVAKACPVNDHGVHEAPFYVLVGAKMPAILVECGYISNADEAARLGRGSYQDLLADGIVAGIAGYKQRIEGAAVAAR